MTEVLVCTGGGAGGSVDEGVELAGDERSGPGQEEGENREYG